MNKKRYPKALILIMFLAFLINNGCVEFPKDRPAASLDINLVHYKVRPKIYFITSFPYSYQSSEETYIINKDDTLRKIVETVIKENKLFDSYSFEKDYANTADYRIDLHLGKNPKHESELITGLKVCLYLSSLTLIPTTYKVDYHLTTSLYDSSGIRLYDYISTNEANVVVGPLFIESFVPPLRMIEKMVKEALFNVVTNSVIIKSYKLEPNPDTTEFLLSHP